MKITMKLIASFLLLFTLTTLTACAPKSNLILHSFYNEVDHYIADTEKDPGARQNAFEKNIQVPFDTLLEKNIASEELSVAKSSLIPEFYASPSILKPYMNKTQLTTVDSAFKEAFTTIESASKNENHRPLHVIYLPTSKPTYAVTGATNLIVFYVNLSEDPKKLSSEIKGIFAHEYVHTLTTTALPNVSEITKTYMSTFLGTAIFEGKACVFAKQLYGDSFAVAYMPTKPLHPIDYYRDILDTPYEITSYQQYRAGEKDFSASDLYYYGIELVDAYIKKHPEIEPKDWLYLTPTEIYDAVYQ